MARITSEKPEIIRRLFKKRWDATTGQLTDPVVYTTDINQEYAEYYEELGLDPKSRNPFAFTKDFLRVRRRANSSWPREVFEAGYSARQVTGDGRSFEFVAVLPGQAEPFPSTAPIPPPDVAPHPISSVSLPLASRRLGRADEPWLIQASVRLHLVETYFALFSARKATVRQIDHLQNGLKLRTAEIDALFLGIEEIVPGTFREFIVTCEAKRFGEDIITEQVLQQVKEVFQLDNVVQQFAVPLALKAISPSRIHLVEYAEVSREEAKTIQAIPLVNQAVFDLVPAVPGIGMPQRTRQRKRAKKGAKAPPAENPV
jgi:hypothetical protein